MRRRPASECKGGSREGGQGVASHGVREDTSRNLRMLPAAQKAAFGTIIQLFPHQLPLSRFTFT